MCTGLGNLPTRGGGGVYSEMGGWESGARVQKVVISRRLYNKCSLEAHLWDMILAVREYNNYYLESVFRILNGISPLNFSRLEFGGIIITYWNAEDIPQSIEMCMCALLKYTRQPLIQNTPHIFNPYCM